MRNRPGFGAPLVSILTPSFGQARWLEDNLQSVASQTYGPIEHIVMDGGSTDGSVQILEDRSRDGLVWSSASDAGQSDAINRAFARSTGEIIGWLNSDDAYFSREAVGQAVRAFEDQPSVGVVYGHAALVNASGLPLQVIWTPPFAQALLPAYNLICQPTVFIRRSALRRPYLVDPAFDYCMDWELWLHLARHTRFFRVNRILAVDRHHLARKSLTRPDLAAHDQELIEAQYRIPKLASARLLHRSVNVGARLAGLAKIREMSHGADALPLEHASISSLAIRQVAQFRRWMPSGDK
jgi:glycosyltransferase involved in cell wall biosynthesis